MTDADVAQICAALYEDQPNGFWTRIWPHDRGYVALQRVANKVDVIVWRGSTTLGDWLEDFQALPTMDRTLGMVHSGFLAGVVSVADAVKSAIARPVIVTGHSLGAGHALIHAGMLAAAGEDILEAVVFGSPRPGGSRLAEILKNVRVSSYKNRSDPVTDVPAGLGYMHPRPLIPVDVAPSFADTWGLLADHHMGLYLTAMQGLWPPKAA